MGYISPLHATLLMLLGWALSGVGCRSATRDSSTGSSDSASSSQDSSQDSSSTDTQVDEVVFPEVSSLSGTEGTLLWTSEDESWIVELEQGDTWETVATGSSPWFVGTAGPDSSLRLRHPSLDQTSTAFSPELVGLSLELDQRMALRGDQLSGSLEVLVDVATLGEASLDLAFSTRDDSGQTLWWDGGCGGSDSAEAHCWVDSVAYLDAWEFPAFRALENDPMRKELSLSLVRRLDSTQVVLSRAQVSYVELGRRLAFGDVHAHSNLSHDGCEVPNAACSSSVGGAGSKFFQHAALEKLDFTALTDHAEYSSYIPMGDTEPIDIWQQAISLAQQAQTRGLIALMGYEWTSIAGHRTVLFEDPAPCEQLRIPGDDETPDKKRSLIGDQFIANNEGAALQPTDLWEGLDAARKECGTADRILTISHHTAMSVPSPVDWTEEKNIPDARFERLVEIASEHGTSECIDTSAPFCDWNLKEGFTYIPEGSIQAALSEGFVLGFVGGTDSHDSRPGSIEDGASCTSHVIHNDEAGHPYHDYPGAITGVYYSGAYGRAPLFDGLAARNTLATTGPRAELMVALIGENDSVFLPGDEVQASTQPLHLEIDLSSPEGLSVIGIDLLDATGEIRETWSQWSIQHDLVALPGEVLYLRLRLEEEGVEQRVWVSPFFIGN